MKDLRNGSCKYQLPLPRRVLLEEKRKIDFYKSYLSLTLGPFLPCTAVVLDDLKPDERATLVYVVEKFEHWLESMHQRGLITYDAEESPETYMGPSVDRSTEKLRAIERLCFNLSAEVPEDPITGGELYIRGALPAGILWMLGSRANSE